MNLNQYLFLDFETASNLDVSVVGLDRYVKDKSTRVLILSWCLGEGEIKTWNPAKGPMPQELRELLLNPSIYKVAWNASFEMGVFFHVLGMYIPDEEWIDAMAWARYLSLPGSLEECGEILGIDPDEAKMKAGRLLIKTFCEPYHKGGVPTLFGISPAVFYNEETHPLQWREFERYNVNDVAAERALFIRMLSLPLTDLEQQTWFLDQKINQTGIPVNRKFAENALSMARKNKEELVAELQKRTGLENPNSVKQLLPWLQERGYIYSSLNKAFVQAAISNPDTPKECVEVLKLRQDASKTSFIKLEKLLDILSDDDRLRYQFMFLGASRSGRWSGSGVQVQNLPRPIKWVEKNLDLAIKLVMEDDYEGLVAALSKEKVPPTIVSVCSSLIRACFQAPEGKKFAVCDLNAIENRVLGWLAGCDAILEVFRVGRDPYLAFAALMYGIDYDTLKAQYDAGDPKAKEMRQAAKPAVLGAGYGLGAGVARFCKKCQRKLKFAEDVPKCHPHAEIHYEAIVVEKKGNKTKTGLMGYAENMGVKLTPEQAYFAWKSFRKAYPEVVRLWDDLQNAAIDTLTTGKKVKVGFVEFDCKVRKNGQKIMRIKLPSGRYLHYINARLEKEIKTSSTGREYTAVSIMYDGIGHGVGQITTGWGSVYTYGGKLAENIVQAISRDLLAHAMLLTDKCSLEICLHVHDEIAILIDEDDSLGYTMLQMNMKTTPDWAPGLPLNAEGYEGKIYKKG